MCSQAEMLVYNTISAVTSSGILFICLDQVDQ